MNEIFNFLSSRSGNNTYYLNSLNHIEDVDLEIYRALESEYSDEIIVNLLNETSWREQLVAYTYILASFKSEHLPLLQVALEKGSFISPQLVVAIAVLGKREMGEYLKSMLSASSISGKSKGAILSVLPSCFINELTIDSFNVDLSEFGMGFRVAEQHMQHWRRVQCFQKP